MSTTTLMASSPTPSIDNTVDPKPAAIDGENRLEVLENRLKNLQGNLSNYSLESLVSSTHNSVSTCAKSVTEPVTPVPVEPSLEKKIDDSDTAKLEVSLEQAEGEHKKNSLLARIKAAQERNNKVVEDIKPALGETKIETQTQTDFVVEPSAPPMLDLMSSAGDKEVVQTDDLPPPTYNDMTIFENLNVESNMAGKSDILKSEDDTAQTATDEATDGFEYTPETIENEVDMNQEIIDEQRRILEQIQKEQNDTNVVLQQLAQERQEKPATQVNDQGFLSWDEHPNNPQNRQLQDNLVANEVSSQNDASPSQYSSRTLPSVVDLGSGTKVKLYSQEKTLESIADGTAKLVQCLNCMAHMKVTQDASLIFCPNCSSVSPVLEVKQKSLQEDADYKLALKLQQQEDSRGNMDAVGSRNNSVSTSAGTAETGWMDWLGGMLYKQKDGAQSTTSSASSSPTRAATGLEHPGRNEPATVAPSTGYFSCVVDSVTNLASRSYEVAQNYSQDDVAFAQLPTRDGDDTTVDYAPLLEEENV
mmetsp:Transcript_27368/g.42491  ORF Transcript_27368/g.42491 Transcript_27368/m.42491 type:complete len:532 (+) Transcript_27368:92-1687(+)